MNRPAILPSLACAGLLALGALAPTPGAARPLYAIARSVNLPGDGGWDALTYEPGGHRLFIAHGTQVDVIDTEHLTVLGAIRDTPGVHAVALAPELKRGYVSAGGSDTVVVFDLATLARLKDIKTTGANPDAILYEPATRRVLAFNGRGRNVTVIDAATETVTATIALDGKPEFAVGDGQGRVYVNLEDKNSVAVIDARTLAVSAVWPLTGCERPTGIALDARGGQLFSACGNRVLVALEIASGRVLGSAPIGAGADGAAYDPSARLAFASCGEGVLSVVAPRPNAPPETVQSVITQRGARTMALDERTHRVYLVTASYAGQPEPPANPRQRPETLPDTFRLLVLESHPIAETMSRPQGTTP
ncbi:MAG TPA: YncE family protein [Steroidobacteraceae bacterium]|nr:YncE family protein [Steroidobacteraceae bacterium]